MWETLKGVDWLAVALNYGPWAISAALAVAAFLIRKAHGKEKALSIARQAFVYVEMVAKLTPGKIDDKLVEGLRVAMAIAGEDLDEKAQAKIATEFERMAVEIKRQPSLALDSSGKPVIK